MSPYYGSSSGQNHKLYDFVAHGSAVTCLALGQKSGRVMVTGGDDAKINLWAIGKPSCVMSLTGHRTSVDCAKFNYNEDIVGAGSASGAIKLWDLEAAKLIQTLTGHKTNVRCLDFHPYGQFLASGSFDTSIKLWDYRKKGCIYTYKVHSKDVHCLKLSPDGRWLASGGNEGSVMLYDIVAGKMLSELKGHSSSVTDVVFHPNEFLLSSSSLDGTVKFWDLESFLQVSTTSYMSDLGPVRKVAFHPDGKALLASGKDTLKVFGWEPTRVYYSSKVNWGKLNDMSVLDDQLIAGTYSMASVSVYMVNLNNLPPFNNSYSIKSPLYSRDNSLRSLESNRTDDIETNGSDGDDSMAEIFNACDYKEIFQSKRESVCRTPPTFESDSVSSDCTNCSTPDRLPHSYSISTLSGGKLNPTSVCGNNNHRSHSPVLTSSVRHLSESMSNLQLSQKNNNLNYSPNGLLNNNHLPGSNISASASINNSSKSHNSVNLSHATSLNALNLRSENSPSLPLLNTPKSQTHHSTYNCSTTLSPLTGLPLGGLSPSNNIGSNVSSSQTSRHHQHKATSNKMTSVVRPVVNDSSRTSHMHSNVKPSKLTHPYVDSGNNQSTAINQATTQNGMISNNNESTFIIPEIVGQPSGLDFDDFLPKHIQKYGYDHQPFVSEMEAINSIMKSHKAAKAGLEYRRKQVQIVLAMWATKDSRTALEYAVNLDEKSIIIDILNVMVLKASLWNLDICLLLLPCIQELLKSKYESYMSVGCNALSLILKTFSAMIKNNISAPPGIGVDISREERYNKCMKCYNHLLSARAFVLKRQTLQGKIGRSFRELSILMQNLE